MCTAGDFSVMIGLMWNYQPVLGVVHRPLLGETVYAVKGRGVFVKASSETRVVCVHNLQRPLNVYMHRDMTLAHWVGSCVNQVTD